jgi:hypothetical protein
VHSENTELLPFEPPFAAKIKCLRTSKKLFIGERKHPNGVIWRMGYQSDWHHFNANLRETYPKIYSPIRVRYANGGEAEGDFLKLLSHVRVIHESPITGWRYIKLNVKQHRSL